MKNKLRILAALLFVAISSAVNAQEKTDIFNPERNSVTSQTIAPDARAAGMGDVGAATDPDVNSQYWNPAKYPFCISRAGVAVNYTPWLRQLVNDMDLAYLAGYYRIGDYSAVSASLRYFSLGEVMTSENAGAMTVNPYEMSIDVAYSLMLSEKFSLAAAVRWIYSDLTYDYTDDTTPGSAFGADLAFYYNNYIMIGARECQLGIGLNISNIGSKITFGGSERSEFNPDVPTLGELGYYKEWYGSARALVLPKGTPQEIVDFYVEAFRKTMQDPACIEAHQKAGMSLDFKDNKQLAELIAAQEIFCRDVVSKLYKK